MGCVYMVDRKLTEREKQIYDMIQDNSDDCNITFRDIVDTIRRDIDEYRYDTKKKLKRLRNGNTHIF